MKIKQVIIFFLAVSFLCLILSGQSSAYNLFGFHRAPLVKFSLEPRSFTSGSSWSNAVIGALDAWSRVVGSDLHLIYEFKGIPWWQALLPFDGRPYDGRNTISWAHLGVPQVLAVTLVFIRAIPSGGEYLDTDIYINMEADNTWVASDPLQETDVNRKSPPYSLKAVMIHELGHAIGLAHEWGALAIMRPVISHYERLMEDDKNAVRAVYPNGEDDVDVSVSNLVSIDSYTAKAEYVKKPSNMVVTPGEMTSIEYTIMNMGTVPLENVGVGFILSDGVNKIILDRSYFNLPVHSEGTFTRDLIIPDWVQPGQYELYVNIDDLNQIGENDESNNLLKNPWGPIRVNAPPVFEPLPEQTVPIHETIVFYTHASDPDGDPINLQINNLPAGAHYDPYANGRLTWTPNCSQLGRNQLSFTVTDKYGAPSSTTVSVAVTAALHNSVPTMLKPWRSADNVYNGIDAYTVLSPGNEQFPFTLTFSGKDDDRDPITFTIYQKPVNAQFAIDTLYWVPKESDYTGEYPITVTASDACGAVSTPYPVLLQLRHLGSGGGGSGAGTGCYSADCKPSLRFGD